MLAALLASALVLAALVVAYALRRSPDACEASRDVEPVRVVQVGIDTYYRVLGDSISAGTGLDEPDDVWLHDLAVHAQAEIKVDAQAGTGFINGGPCGDRAFADRVDRLAEPDGRGGWYTIIVQGGSEDVASDPAEVEKAATEVLTKLRDSDAHWVVLIGPVDAPGRQGERAISKALGRAARAAGVGFVPVINLDLDFQTDGLHLSKEGQSSLAAKIVRTIAEGD